MKVRELLPYGVGLLLALALVFACLWWRSQDSESSGEGSGSQTLPEVYDVL